MKLLSSFILLTFIGCGHVANRQHATTKSSDALLGESMQRVPSGMLNDISQADKSTLATLATCHQGDTSRGRNILAENFKSKKKTAQYWSAIGTCYLLEKNFQKAEFFYQMAKQNSRGTTLAQVENNIGILYLALDQYQLAEKMFIDANRHGSALKSPVYNLGNLYLGHNMAGKALPFFMKLYKSNAQDPEVLGALGNIYLIKGQYKKSIRYFEKMGTGISLRPIYVQHYALALYHQGQKKKAAQIIGEAPATSDSRFEKMGQKILAEIGR